MKLYRFKFGVNPTMDPELNMAPLKIGSRKPSELLRYMKRRAESLNVDNKLMKELFLQHLPSSVQTILAAVSDLTLNKTADIADRILEVSPSPIETFAVSNKKE
ncbi:transposon Ty3-G Gag-Pol polyprotein [Trichonephila clavipes]|nr:transposon Ty3-G Gag-Pol polyprotein [Trichonephila clavipes]